MFGEQCLESEFDSEHDPDFVESARATNLYRIQVTEIFRGKMKAIYSGEMPTPQLIAY